jgi:sugar phosphate permease
MRCGFQNPPGTNALCANCGNPLTIGADPVMRAILPVGRTVLSIVAGYLGLAAMLCFPAPIALAVGIWAVVDLRKRPGMHGMGRAVFGIVAGAIGTIGLAFAIISALARHGH